MSTNSFSIEVVVCADYVGASIMALPLIILEKLLYRSGETLCKSLFLVDQVCGRTEPNTVTVVEI